MDRLRYQVTTTVGPVQEQYEYFSYYTMLCYPYRGPLVRQGAEVRIVLELDDWSEHETQWFDECQERGGIGPWSYRRIV